MTAACATQRVRTVMRKISEFYLQERIGIGYTHQMRSKKATSPT